MRKNNSGEETINHDGRFYFLAEVSEPSVEGGWGFILQSVDSTKHNHREAVGIMEDWAKDFAATHLTGGGYVKVRSINENSVITEEFGSDRTKRVGKPLAGINLLKR